MAVAPIARAFLLASLAAATLVLPVALGYGNILLTGETLNTDQSLTYGNYTFIVQGDCNLVLYNGHFQSNTHGNGKSCSATLTNKGQLVVKDDANNEVWSSPAGVEEGNYVAVLRPDGVGAVYGPQVWISPSPSPSSRKAAAIDESKAALGTTPKTNNLLFSGQILTAKDGNKLTTRDYTLKMVNCDVTLDKDGKVLWKSDSFPGPNCFARLGHHGRFSVLTDTYELVYDTKSPTSAYKVGEYVLALQMDGRAAVYGPIIWTTTPL